MQPMEPNLATVRARRAEIARQRKSIDEEDAELAVAERALVRLALPRQTNGAVLAERPTTNIDLIVEALKRHSEPWVRDAKHLHALIVQEFSIDMKESSLMPLLSRLRSEGVIRRQDSKIALTQRVG